MSLPSLLRVASVFDVSPSKLLEGLGTPAKTDAKRSQAKKRVSR